MQPNQQDPNAQPGVPQSPAPAPTQPLPYQVPEYLGLEPTPLLSQPGRSRKVRLAIIGVLLVAVVAIAAVLAVLAASSKSDTLAAAIGNGLRTTRVRRTVTIRDSEKSESPLVIKLNTTLDLSDDANKKLSADYSIEDGNTSDSKPYKQSGKIVLSGTRYLGYIEQTTSPVKQITSGKWYEINWSDSNAIGMFDPLSLASIVASQPYLGVVPIANVVDDTNYEKLLAYIEENKIFTTGSGKDENGNKVYEVTATAKGVGDLQQKIADVTAIKHAGKLTNSSPNTWRLTIRVDAKTKRVINVSGERLSAKGDKLSTIDASYTYPADVTIESPENVTEYKSE